jgi:hypothetical protein
MIKSSEETQNKRNIANIILNGEKLITISSKIRNDTRVSSLPILFNIVLKFLARAKKTEERNKMDSNREERSQIILFADDMI